jgi:hypothetical protein
MLSIQLKLLEDIVKDFLKFSGICPLISFFIFPIVDKSVRKEILFEIIEIIFYRAVQAEVIKDDVHPATLLNVVYPATMTID